MFVDKVKFAIKECIKSENVGGVYVGRGFVDFAWQDRALTILLEVGESEKLNSPYYSEVAMKIAKRIDKEVEKAQVEHGTR